MPSIDWDFILEETLEYARYFAAKSSTLIDDRAVELLAAIQNDPTVRNWFLGKIEDGASGVNADGTLSMVHDEPPAAVAEALFDGKVFKGLSDIQEVMAALREAMPYILEIVKFVRLLTGK